ncbi:hypothetical protein VSH64_16135 [Amycolatopsis rhabdoformis]|uniref:Uncharacterized protein n=1 Tax=Amycolatopsis rhabdoformis TaxID=1448059 RepID=A0ABZ1II44_9PSEU|nr:hypothetical protein [Amycolatopsis rhabdoformis]WSE33617.1 hypothetical protein VSH64_16135 [Amycolatopsis rhabdoformis]
MATTDDPAAPLRLLVGRRVSAVCSVRDYVELHFDGPVLRALADPFGLYGCRSWRFPEGQSPTLMRFYLGTLIDSCELIPDRFLAVDSGEHRFAIPLDDASRPGPEAAHLIGVDEHDRTDTRKMWIW